MLGGSSLLLLLLILIVGLVMGANKYRVDSSSSELLYKFDGLYVENNCAFDIFIPARTQTEYYSISTHTPACVNAGECYGWTGWKDIEYDKICCSKGVVMDYEISGTSARLFCCDTCRWSEWKHLDRCDTSKEIKGPYVDFSKDCWCIDYSSWTGSCITYECETSCEDSICCENGNLVDYEISGDKARVKCCP